MATSAETYAAALKPYTKGGTSAPNLTSSIQKMIDYNSKMNLGLTDAQIVAGIQAFGNNHNKNFGNASVSQASNYNAIAAESIMNALNLAGKDGGAFWNNASKDAYPVTSDGSIPTISGAGYNTGRLRAHDNWNYSTGGNYATTDNLDKALNDWTQGMINPLFAFTGSTPANTVGYVTGQEPMTFSAQQRKTTADMMRGFNDVLNLGLTEEELAKGINQFSGAQYQIYNQGYNAGSDPYNIARWSVWNALNNAGKTELGDSLIEKTNAKQAITANQAEELYNKASAYVTKTDNDIRIATDKQGDRSFGDHLKAIAKGVAPIAGLFSGLGAFLGPAGGIASGTSALGSLADGLGLGDLYSSATSTFGGLFGDATNTLGGLFGDAAGSAADFFGEGTAGAVADYGTTAGTATTATTGGSMSWLDDIADWWSGDDILSQWTDVASDAGSSFGNYDWPSLGLGETGILGSGGGYTGLSGTIDGLGTLTDAGMLIPAAGGAAVSLSSLSPSIWSNIIDKAVADPLGTAGKLAKTLGIFKEDGSINPSLVSGLLSVGGGILTGNAATDATQTAANAQLEAARIAADAAKFKPVGVTTRFGQSNFTKDAQGNVTDAGYTMPADIRAMQDSLLGAAPGMLSQFTGSQAATAPMGAAAQRMMQLGNGYLSTDPQAQAQKYYDDQQAIMAAGRARDQAGALTGEFNRGTYGLATGATGMMGAANPRLEAMYNAQRQQDLQAAANATQGGMDYAKFGSTMTGLGGTMLRDMYGTQTAAYNPYATAMTGAQNIEGLGQNALDLSVNMGKVASPAESGRLLGQGMLGAANTMQQANQYSPWGTALMNAGNALNTMNQPQNQNPTYDPSRFRLVPFGS